MKFRKFKELLTERSSEGVDFYFSVFGWDINVNINKSIDSCYRIFLEVGRLTYEFDSISEEDVKLFFKEHKNYISL